MQHEEPAYDLISVLDNLGIRVRAALGRLRLRKGFCRERFAFAIAQPAGNCAIHRSEVFGFCHVSACCKYAAECVRMVSGRPGHTALHDR